MLLCLVEVSELYPLSIQLTFEDCSANYTIIAENMIECRMNEPVNNHARKCVLWFVLWFCLHTHRLAIALRKISNAL